MFFGRPDLQETLVRLRAYANAGADCLYAPGVRTREQISAIVEAAGQKPVNVLMAGSFGLTVQDLAGLGVRRVSVGSALCRVAWAGFMRAARTIAEEGRFDVLAEGVPFAELNGFFREV